MARKAAKEAADNKQVQVPAQGTEVQEDRDLTADVQQEEPAEEMPDAGVQQAQQPFPDPGMNELEIMNPPEETQEAPEKMVDAEIQQFLSDLEDDQQEEQAGQSGRQPAATYRITCRNKISKAIGGVSFVDGVGYTSDGFTASWFGNKDGYEVKEAGF